MSKPENAEFVKIDERDKKIAWRVADIVKASIPDLEDQPRAKELGKQVAAMLAFSLAEDRDATLTAYRQAFDCAILYSRLEERRHSKNAISMDAAIVGNMAMIIGTAISIMTSRKA